MRVNLNVARRPNVAQGLEVSLGRVGLEAEVDEPWWYVANKSNPRWLWCAVDHHTNTVLAYVLGRRQDEVFKELKTLLEPMGMDRYYTDDWGTYKRYLKAEEHQVGKQNTQKIERKNLNWRTWIKRLVRKTLCFSKLKAIHDTLIGLIINQVEFGIDIHAV